MTTLPDHPWPASEFPGLLFGGDYNPEQWSEAMGYEGDAIWRDDMRLMKLAGVNVATVGVFSWAALQPDEHSWTFDWLDRLLDMRILVDALLASSIGESCRSQGGAHG